MSAQPNSKVRLNGWAFDPDDPAAALSVAIYMDGVGMGWFTTTVSRPDVNTVCGILGAHGFSILVDAPPGDHLMDVYAINAAGGPNNPLIGRMSVQVGLPMGCLDRAVANGQHLPRTTRPRAPAPTACLRPARRRSGSWPSPGAAPRTTVGRSAHLFPSMPRSNLRRAQRIVQPFCTANSVTCTETTLRRCRSVCSTRADRR